MQWICEKTNEPQLFNPLGQAAAIKWNQDPLQNVLVDVASAYKPCLAFFKGEDAPLPSRHIVRKYVNGRFGSLG